MRRVRILQAYTNSHYTRAPGAIEPWQPLQRHPAEAVPAKPVKAPVRRFHIYISYLDKITF